MILSNNDINHGPPMQVLAELFPFSLSVSNDFLLVNKKFASEQSRLQVAAISAYPSIELSVIHFALAALACSSRGERVVLLFARR